MIGIEMKDGTKLVGLELTVKGIYEDVEGNQIKKRPVLHSCEKSGLNPLKRGMKEDPVYVFVKDCYYEMRRTKRQDQ